PLRPRRRGPDHRPLRLPRLPRRLRRGLPARAARPGARPRHSARLCLRQLGLRAFRQPALSTETRLTPPVPRRGRCGFGARRLSALRALTRALRLVALARGVLVRIELTTTPAQRLDAIPRKRRHDVRQALDASLVEVGKTGARARRPQRASLLI